MLVVTCVGVEIASTAVDGDLAHEPGVRELVQRVVDGGERKPYPALEHVAMKVVDSDMTVLAPEQEPAERQSLPGRPQARAAQDRVGALELCRADLAFGPQAFSGFFWN